MRYTQNRELSWLNFNKRVLEIGTDKDTPLFERLKFVAIFQSNLSEFFMIRVGGLHDMAQVKNDFRDNKSFMTAQEQLDAVYEECVPLEHQRDQVFASIEEELRGHGVYRRTWDDLDDEQLEYVQDYAESSVMPLLSAQVIDQSHPFPHLQNGKLYVAMELHRKASGTDKKGGKKKPDGTPLVGIIPMPPMVPRIIRLPGDDLQYMLLEDALCSLAPQIFEMYETGEPAVICVTRNADIDPDDEDYADDDYRQHMKKILKKRTRLAPVRLQVQGHMRNMRELITRHLDLESEQVFHLESPIDLSYVYKLENELSPEQKQELLYKPFSPVWPASISRKKSMFDQIKRHDILLSYPYDSMEPFIALLREAATDPAVASIKITLYRLASISKIAECLVTAAENGKDVVVLMELRARFDEEANIGWAEHFEEAGCTVIYGMEGYKCHSKICQITRLGDDGLELYTQMATGNYNEKTAKQYTDLALMTFDKQIGIDGVDFFNNMSMGNLDGKYTKLWVSPTSFKSNVIAKIDEQIEIAKAGGRGRIIIKCNSVTDVDLIHKLAEASCAGVKIDLIVRGICCLLPGIEGETENISVISIVGRLLEHSRIYCFGEGADTTVYLASADMMTRNTERRVEIGFPVESPDIKRRVLDFVDAQLADTANASKLQPDGSYVKLSAVTKGKLFDSQQYFIDDALERASTPKKKKEKKRAARAEMVDKQMEEVRAAISEEENAEASENTGAVVAAVAGSAVVGAAAADGKDASSPKSKKKGKESAETGEAGDDLGKAPAAAAEIEAAADDADDAIEDAPEPADDAGADAVSEKEDDGADEAEIGAGIDDGTEEAPEAVTEDGTEANETGDATEVKAPTEPEAGEPVEADARRAPAATTGPAIGAASAAIAAVLAGAAATAASESEDEPEETATDAPASRAEDAAVDESEPDAAAADGTPIAETPAAETAAGEQPVPEDIAKTEDSIEPEKAPGTQQLDGSAFAAADEHEPDDKRKAQWDEQVKADEADRQRDWDAAAEVGYASDLEPEMPAESSAEGDAAEAGIGTGTEESAAEPKAAADIEGTVSEDATEAETKTEPEAASEKSVADTVAEAEKAPAAVAGPAIGAASAAIAAALAGAAAKAEEPAAEETKTVTGTESESTEETPATMPGAAEASEPEAEAASMPATEPEPASKASAITEAEAAAEAAAAPEAETAEAAAEEHVAEAAVEVGASSVSYGFADYLASRKVKATGKAGAKPKTEPAAEAAEQPVAEDEAAPAAEAAAEPTAGTEPEPEPGESATSKTTETADWTVEPDTETGEPAAQAADVAEMEPETETDVSAEEPAAEPEAVPEAEAEATPAAVAGPAIGAASAAIAAALAGAAAKAEEPTTAEVADGNEAPIAATAETANGNETPAAEAVAFEELAAAPRAEADAVEPAAGPETIEADTEDAVAETAMEQETEEEPAAGTAEATFNGTEPAAEAAKADADATEPETEAGAAPAEVAGPAIGAASAAIAAALAGAAAKAEEPTTAEMADGNEAPIAATTETANGNEAPAAEAAKAAHEAVTAEEPETATESAPVKAPTEKLYRQSGTCNEQAPTEPEPASEPQAGAPAAQSPTAGSEPGNAGGPTIASTAAAGSMTVTTHDADSEDTVTVSDDTDAHGKDGTSAIIKVEHATTASFEPRKTVADNAKENAPKKKSLFSRIGSFFSRIFKRKKKPAGYLEAGDPDEYENK